MAPMAIAKTLLSKGCQLSFSAFGVSGILRDEPGDDDSLGCSELPNAMGFHVPCNKRTMWDIMISIYSYYTI
jgi:hypothetical protein